jgi:hypothetical protein
VPELKRMLEKAEAVLDIQKCKVRALEAIVLELGGELPKEEDIAKLTSADAESQDTNSETNSARENFSDQEEIKSDMTFEDPNESQMFVSNDMLQEKID